MFNESHNHEYHNNMHQIREPETKLQMVSSSSEMKSKLFACDQKCKGSKHKKHHKKKED